MKSVGLSLLFRFNDREIPFDIAVANGWNSKDNLEDESCSRIHFGFVSIVDEGMTKSIRFRLVV